ncbi:MAG: hypothetical protein LBN23_08085 [Paludibacter sp.]|jgi:hypothetical protein|nr:hypothetical protein [Paludibacter sp.]
METPTLERKTHRRVAIKNINPNTPQQLTDTEWVNYFSLIERGNFTDLDISNNNFAEWKKNTLSRL